MDFSTEQAVRMMFVLATTAILLTGLGNILEASSQHMENVTIDETGMFATPVDIGNCPDLKIEKLKIQKAKFGIAQNVSEEKAVALIRKNSVITVADAEGNSIPSTSVKIALEDVDTFKEVLSSDDDGVVAIKYSVEDSKGRKTAVIKNVILKSDPNNVYNKEGWITEKGHTRYYKDNQYVTGYTSIDGGFYAFDASTGYQLTGYQILDGKPYIFRNKEGPDGVGLERGFLLLDENNEIVLYGRNNVILVSGEWVDPDSSRNLKQAQCLGGGELLASTSLEFFCEFGGELIGTRSAGVFNFNAEGFGTRQKNGWTYFKEGKKRYYYSTNGDYAIGYSKIEGENYGFDKDGFLLTGYQVIDGKPYCFDNNKDSGKVWKNGAQALIADNTGKVIKSFNYTKEETLPTSVYIVPLEWIEYENDGLGAIKFFLTPDRQVMANTDIVVGVMDAANPSQIGDKYNCHIDGNGAATLTETTSVPVLEAGTEFNASIPRKATSIVFTDEVAPAGITTIDVSAEKNGSVVAWLDGTIYKVSAQKSGVKVIGNPDCSKMFKSKMVKTIDFGNFDASNVKSMVNMFYNCKALATLDVTSFDTSNVTDMSYMFARCGALNSLVLTNFDTSKVKNMEKMFDGCVSLTTLDLSSFDTSNVKSMVNMFYNCNSLATLDLSSFDTSNVTKTDYMFDLCSATIGWGRTLEDCDKLNSSLDKPEELLFRVKYNPSKAATNIIEEGTLDGWEYRIWSDGTKECWKTLDLGSVALTQNMTAAVYSNTDVRAKGIALPTGLYSKDDDYPQGYASVQSGGYTHCQVCDMNTSQMTVRVWSSYPQIVNTKLSLYVIGGSKVSSEDSSTKIESAAYVTEEGTLDGWAYKYWSDGTRECWRTVDFQNANLTSYMATGVYSNSDYARKTAYYPAGMFDSAPKVLVSTETSGYTNCQVSEETRDYAAYRVWASYPQTVNVSVNLYAIGKTSYVDTDKDESTKTKDYVVEEGIKQGWKYRVWNNGRKECWLKEGFSNVALTTNYATDVYSRTDLRWRDAYLPDGFFTEKPNAQISVLSNGYTHCQVAYTTTSKVNYRLWSSYPCTTNLTTNIYVSGR